VQAHQPVAAPPVDRHRDCIAESEPVAGRKPVADLPAVLAGLQHVEAADRAGIALLPAGERVEDGGLQRDLLAVHRGDAGIKAGAVGIVPEQLPGHGGLAESQ